MTKLSREIYQRYTYSDKYSLYTAYSSFSEKKAKAWEYCESLCKEKNGTALKVIGANSSFFSAGFLFEEDGKKKLMYITHCGEREIEL